MRAVYYERLGAARDVLKLGDVEMPQVEPAEVRVRVHASGGVQTVRWDGEVFLRGPAQIICQGEFFI